MADPKNLDEVRQVFARTKEELMGRYGAHGAGIGKTASGDAYTIVLYLERNEQLPSGQAEIEGVPLRFEVTGPIRLHTH